ncbi:MAG: hypothetical protein ABSF29_02300 [Tepidisphaeraceae bacterium]|jgi:hypothetical protein
MKSRALLYVWAFPTTAVGLPLAVATVLSGGKAGVVQGVLEVHGPAAEFFLRRVVGVFLKGGASAITFGHIVLGRDQRVLEMTRAHERVHVRQAELWGPLFLPVYLGASLWALARGGRAYEDNFLEKEAFKKTR